jgi:hypothetical protein
LRNDNFQRLAGAFGLVVTPQPFAKPISLDSHHGIFFGIELGRPAEGLNRDIVFLDLILLTLEMALAYIREKPRKRRGPGESRRLQDGFYFGPFAVKTTRFGRVRPFAYAARHAKNLYLAKTRGQYNTKPAERKHRAKELRGLAGKQLGAGPLHRQTRSGFSK